MFAVYIIQLYRRLDSIHCVYVISNNSYNIGNKRVLVYQVWVHSAVIKNRIYLHQLRPKSLSANHYATIPSLTLFRISKTNACFTSFKHRLTLILYALEKGQNSRKKKLFGQQLSYTIKDMLFQDQFLF